MNEGIKNYVFFKFVNLFHTLIGLIPFTKNLKKTNNIKIEFNIFRYLLAKGTKGKFTSNFIM